MDVFVDGQAYAVQVGDETTISDVLKQIKAQYTEDDRIITTMTCDGEVIEPEDLERALNTAALAYDQMELTTESPWDLGKAALSRASELFGETKGMMAEVVELLNQEQPVRAMDVLGNCMGAWNQASESVRQTGQLLGLDLDSVSLDGQPLTELFEILRDQLLSIKDTLGSRDFAALADILQYELPETADQWQAMIDVVCQEIDAARPTA